MTEKLTDEEHYKREYNLLKDVHYRKGEILRLEYINANYCREIEKLNVTNDEKDKSIGKCLRRIDEHLQDKARLTINSKLKSEYIKDLESKLSTRRVSYCRT